MQSEEVRYDNVHTVHKTFMEIDSMGKKSITGKVTVSTKDFEDLSTMAKQSVAARSKIFDLERENKRLREVNWDLQSRINRLSERLYELEQICAPYLKALKLMPEKVKSFFAEIFKTDREENKEPIIKNRNERNR